MKLYVGPVPQASALVWIAWAHEVLENLHDEFVSAVSLSDPVLDRLDAYLDSWDHTLGKGETFRWYTEVDLDELEYVTNAFYNLDLTLAADIGQGRRTPPPAAGSVFHAVLVQALLQTLALASPVRAGFAEQMRWSWPSFAMVD